MQAALVDPGRTPGHDRDLRCEPQDHRIKLGTAGRRLQLGVIQRRQCADVRRTETIHIEQHRGGDQWSRKTASPSFVGASHKPDAKRAVMAKELRPWGTPLHRSRPATSLGRLRERLLEEADPVERPVGEERHPDDPLLRHRPPESAVV